MSSNMQPFSNTTTRDVNSREISFPSLAQSQEATETQLSTYPSGELAKMQPH